METDQQASRPRTGSFYVAEDSFLLSDYLHRQAENAGNRFFKDANSLIFLRSKLFSSELKRKEAKENSNRCNTPEFKSTPLGLSVAHKDSLDSLDSLTGRECNSRNLSELEREKGSSSFPHAIQASSDSTEQSSHYHKFADAATTRKEANILQCHESKQAISLSIDDDEGEDADAYEDDMAEDISTAFLSHTEALNLLVTAAIQLGNENEDDSGIHVGTVSLKSPDRTIEGGYCGATAVQGPHRPMLKRKVIRRAKSAFQGQKHNDRASKLAVTRAMEKNARHMGRTHIIDLEDGRVSHEGSVDDSISQGVSFHLSDAVAAACMNMHEALERKQGEVKKELIKGCGEPKEEISQIENSPARIPSSLSAEASKIAKKQHTNHMHFVDHRKLQVSSARLWSLCNAEPSVEMQIHAQRTPQLRTERSQPSGLTHKEGPSKGVARACTIREEIRSSSMDRLESREGEACLGFIQMDNTAKRGSSTMRLKILPIKLPIADLPLLQEVSKSESTDMIPEGRMVTRRKCFSTRKQDKAMLTSELMEHKEVPMQESLVVDGDPVIRSKRGRSRVLPTKFSDSVLQPLKRSKKKSE